MADDKAGPRRSRGSQYDARHEKYRADWRDITGRRRRHLFRTKGEADQAWALGKLQNPKAHNRPRAGSVTFATFAADYIERRAPELSGATTRNRRLAVDAVKDSLGPLPLSQIDRETFRGALARVRAEGRKASGRAASSVNTIRRGLRVILHEALLLGLITQDPTLEPKTKRVGQFGADEDEVAALTEQQAKAVLDVARKAGGERYAVLALLLLSGIRLGELLALKPQDVDSERGFLRIRRSLTRDDGIKATKTRAGRRDIPMAAELKEATQHLRGEWLLWPDAERVAGDKANALQARVGRLVRSVGRKAGITGLHPHLLRHTFCSALVASGTNLYEVQRMAGHRDLATTMRIYGSHLPPQDSGAIARLAERLTGA
jgi:integrase